MQDGRIELSLAGLPFPITLRPPVRLSDDDAQRFCEQNDLLRVEIKPNGGYECSASGRSCDRRLGE